MQKSFNKLPKKARYCMLISDVISFIIFGAICLGINKALVYFNAPKLLNEFITYGIYIIGAFIIIESILTQFIEYPRIKYAVDEDSVEVIKGLHFIDHTIVPVRRMQQISIEQGPLQKCFNLAGVTIVTSGGSVSIDNIDRQTAEKIANNLKLKINQYVKNYNDNEDTKDAAPHI